MLKFLWLLCFLNLIWNFDHQVICSEQSTDIYNLIQMLKAFELLQDVSHVLVVRFSKLFFSRAGIFYGYLLSPVPLL